MSLKTTVTVLAITGFLSSTSAVSLADNNWSAGSDRLMSESDKHRPASEFEYVTITVEQNATDGDTEILVAAKPDSDNGLVKFTVKSPDGRKVAESKSPRSVGGMREFSFESPEPAGDAILASYPEGEYRFEGKASDGERFAGTGNLSHLMPAATTIIFPMQDATVGSDALTIQWSQVPDAAEFRIEFENESMDPAQVLTLNVPADVTSFDVPASLLVPGAEYQVGIAVIGENGNLISVEVQFTTAE